MNGTLYALDLLQSGAGFMVAGLIGILFGFFLEQAGFGSSRKLTAVFYFRDMAVIKVMLTAAVVCLVGYHYLVALGWLSPAQIRTPDTYWYAQIIGGLLFGVGFVMGGWCPGTAFVGLAAAKLDALVFLLGVVLGSILFNEVFGLLRPLYEGGNAGVLTLYDSLNFSPFAIILAACLIAVAIFIGSSLLEKSVAGSGAISPRGWKTHGIAAAILVIFAAGLYVVPQRAPVTAAPVPRKGYLGEVTRTEEYVAPLELAERIMKGEPGLVLVDVRSPEDYESFHLRDAVNVPVEELARSADEKIPRDGRIVLYSNGTTRAAQAWLELRHWGWTNAGVLTDGLLGFWRQCLTPPSLRSVDAEQTTGEEWKAFQVRRDYFLPPEK